MRKACQRLGVVETTPWMTVTDSDLAAINVNRDVNGANGARGPCVPRCRGQSHCTLNCTLREGASRVFPQSGHARTANVVSGRLSGATQPHIQQSLSRSESDPRRHFVVGGSEISMSYDS